MRLEREVKIDWKLKRKTVLMLLLLAIQLGLEKEMILEAYWLLLIITES